MEYEQVLAMATRLHARYGKTYHSQQEALEVILPLWQGNPLIEVATLFQLATSGSGVPKSHISGAKEGKTKKGFNSPGVAGRHKRDAVRRLRNIYGTKVK